MIKKLAVSGRLPSVPSEVRVHGDFRCCSDVVLPYSPRPREGSSGTGPGGGRSWVYLTRSM
ncbi:hypothetical protein DPMN_186975 [Dreissena polymorpha]|uniref:Uncharacterized protein n=1 Tax=Dreissena polymorpha TaxID=45954 RepID=A0A9D4DR95_DREPO|nr:hypothetical protein DPMN_186975 [Dreissena polymorpha]